MENYKIRVTSRPGTTIVEERRLACDHAAVRHGQSLAHAGDKLEVWRGAECIFMSEELGTGRVQGPAYH
ncbi:MAG: hypothetical protein JWQ19_3995 [Subtercola sp.]|nr:hypothetical protein [Subtercola sp.]